MPSPQAIAQAIFYRNTVLYVGGPGTPSDNNAGTSATAPLSTLQAAIAKQPDVIFIYPTASSGTGYGRAQGFTLDWTPRDGRPLVLANFLTSSYLSGAAWTFTSDLPNQYPQLGFKNTPGTWTLYSGVAGVDAVYYWTSSVGTVQYVYDVGNTITYMGQTLWSRPLKVADIASVQATAGTWYYDSGTSRLYLRRSTSDAPGSNIRVPNNSVVISIGANARNVVLWGLDIWGATTAGIQAKSLTSPATIYNSFPSQNAFQQELSVWNCRLRYNGAQGVGAAGGSGDALNIEAPFRVSIEDTEAFGNASDAFNFDNLAHAEMKNCYAYKNGDPLDVNANGLTAHTGSVVNLDGGVFAGNSGPDIALVTGARGNLKNFLCRDGGREGIIATGERTRLHIDNAIIRDYVNRAAVQASTGAWITGGLVRTPTASNTVANYSNDALSTIEIAESIVV